VGWAEQLPSGRYRAVYRDSTGQKRNASPGQTYTHKKAAVRAANAVEHDARKSTWRNPDRGLQTWGEWCRDGWWPSRDVEASTMRHDRYRKDKYLLPRWSDVPLAGITRADVKKWAAELAQMEIGREDDAGNPILLSPSTVQRVVHLLSASLTAAMDAEILASNPAYRLKLPPPPQALERYLTHEEYFAILEEMPTDRDVLVMELLANTGIRWGEMAGAHLHRLNEVTGTLLVVESWDVENRKMKAYPKGRRIRDVPVPKWLIKKLLDLPHGETCGQPHQGCRSGLLITAAEGGPMDGHNWTQRVWGPAVERAGVGHVRAHDLRHSYASWQLQAGRSLEEIGRLLGHKSLLTTQKYSHLAEMPHDHIIGALPGARRGARGARRGAKRVPERSAKVSPESPNRQSSKGIRSNSS
jgi:integrase